MHVDVIHPNLWHSGSTIKFLCEQPVHVHTCVRSEAEVASPVPGINERDVGIDVGTAHTTANYHSRVNDRTILHL